MISLVVNVFHKRQRVPGGSSERIRKNKAVWSFGIFPCMAQVIIVSMSKRGSDSCICRMASRERLKLYASHFDKDSKMSGFNLSPSASLYFFRKGNKGTLVLKQLKIIL